MFNSDAERRLRRQLPHGSTGPAQWNPPTSTPFPTGQSIADGVAVYSFDGQGNFTDLNFAMRDGVPNVPAGTPGLTPDGFTSQTGTYHINPDCTGAGTMSQANLSTTFVIVVGDRGRTFRIVGTPSMWRRSQAIRTASPAVIWQSKLLRRARRFSRDGEAPHSTHCSLGRPRRDPPHSVSSAAE